MQLKYHHYKIGNLEGDVKIFFVRFVQYFYWKCPLWYIMQKLLRLREELRGEHQQCTLVKLFNGGSLDYGHLYVKLTSTYTWLKVFILLLLSSSIAMAMHAPISWMLGDKPHNFQIDISKICEHFTVTEIFICVFPIY